MPKGSSRRPSYFNELLNLIQINTLLEGGYNKEVLFEKAKLLGYPSCFSSFDRYLRYIKKENGTINKLDSMEDQSKKLIKILELKKSLKCNEVESIISCSKNNLEKLINNCRANGYEIHLDNNNIILSTTNARDPEKIEQISDSEIIFGVISDPHFGSKSCQLTAINEFCEIMKKKGVKHIFCPGDLVAGFDVYPGQIHDVYTISAKEQEETTLLNLPTGFKWYILGGNHDYSFIKKGGYNIISVLALKRKDIHYIGFDSADIPILKNVDLKLFHPSGGVPYSFSYRLQKSMEQITISELQSIVWNVKEKPTVRFVLAGHLHIQLQAMFGSIWGAQCGTFEGQTNYLKRKGLIPTIGGWIVKASLGPNGLLKNFESKFYLFNEIEDDWKNYKHSLPEEKIDKPIFV